MSRRNKLTIGSVALLSASAIAVTPMASTSPALLSAQQQSMSVGLVAKVTDSPAEVYGALFSNTINNIAALSAAVQANPSPLQSQIAENQQGYFTRFTDMLETYPAGIEESFAPDGRAGRHLVAMQEALEAGEIFTAYQEYNAASLYASLAIVAPFTNLLLSRTPRGSTEEIPGIPAQMAQNFANAVGALFSAQALQSGIFYASFAATSGTVYEGARIADALYKAIQAGDAVTASNVLVNTPGALLNAFINGFDYSEDDDVEAWPGLLAPKGDRHSGGLVYQTLVGLGQSIAEAIDNTPPAPPAPAGPSALPPTGATLLAVSVDEQVEAKDDEAAVQQLTAVAKDTGAVETDDAAASEVAVETDDAAASKVAVETDDAAASEVAVAVEVPAAAEAQEPSVDDASSALTASDAKKALASASAEESDTKGASTAAERAAKSKADTKADVAKANERINATVEKVSDGLKKLTGVSKSKADNDDSDSDSGDSGSDSGDSGGDSGGSGGDSGGSSGSDS